jgi:hypothetical protein
MYMHVCRTTILPIFLRIFGFETALTVWYYLFIIFLHVIYHVQNVYIRYHLYIPTFMSVTLLQCNMSFNSDL